MQFYTADEIKWDKNSIKISMINAVSIINTPLKNYRIAHLPSAIGVYTMGIFMQCIK